MDEMSALEKVKKERDEFKAELDGILAVLKKRWRFSGSKVGAGDVDFILAEAEALKHSYTCTWAPQLLQAAAILRTCGRFDQDTAMDEARKLRDLSLLTNAEWAKRMEEREKDPVLVPLE